MDNNQNCVILFNELYEKYYKKLLSYFRKEFDADEAEDLTQQTFLQLWGWIANIQFVKNKKAYIFRIAKNVRCDRYRQKALMLNTVSLADDFEISDNSVFTDDIDFRLSFNTGLTFQDRQLLVMKEQGLSSKEIGKMLGISSSAVRSRLQKLRKRIKDNGNNI
ncbi:MAG: RNA polymerase sigma factor [Eubacterium sp.]